MDDLEAGTRPATTTQPKGAASAPAPAPGTGLKATAKDPSGTVIVVAPKSPSSYAPQAAGGVTAGAETPAAGAEAPPRLPVAWVALLTLLRKVPSGGRGAALAAKLDAQGPPRACTALAALANRFLPAPAALLRPPKLSPETKLWLAKQQAKLPKPPKSMVHFFLLYDKCLNHYVPHGLR